MVKEKQKSRDIAGDGKDVTAVRVDLDSRGRRVWEPGVESEFVGDGGAAGDFEQRSVLI